MGNCLNCGGTVGAGVEQAKNLENTQPLNSADAQVAEAMAVAKARNQELARAESILPYVEKMDAMNVSTAVQFLMDQSPAEKEKYLKAEKISKNRKTVLGYFGWA